MARIYNAKYGDSLSGIAQKYGVNVDTLRQYNHIGSGDHFCVGENIYIDEERKIIGFNALDEEYSTIHFMTKNYDTAENMLNSIKNNEQLEGKV